MRATSAGHEAALRAGGDPATARLEGVPKRVMLQTEDARDTQRHAEAALSTTRQRNDHLIVVPKPATASMYKEALATLVSEDEVTTHSGRQAPVPRPLDERYRYCRQADTAKARPVRPSIDGPLVASRCIVQSKAGVTQSRGFFPALENVPPPYPPTGSSR